jgi:hypothetical protein
MLSTVELREEVEALGADLVDVEGVRGGHQRALRPGVKPRDGRFGRPYSGDGKIPSRICQNEIISQLGQHKAIDRI